MNREWKDGWVCVRGNTQIDRAGQVAIPQRHEVCKRGHAGIQQVVEGRVGGGGELRPPPPSPGCVCV